MASVSGKSTIQRRFTTTGYAPNVMPQPRVNVMGSAKIHYNSHSAAKAYPLRLIGEAAVNDRVGGQPVVIFSRELTGSAFLATVQGKQLTFEFKPALSQAEGNGLFVDRETASTWNAVGEAVAGPLKGTGLKSTLSRRAFWFSIAGAIPGLELYLP